MRLIQCDSKIRLAGSINSLCKVISTAVVFSLWLHRKSWFKSYIQHCNSGEFHEIYKVNFGLLLLLLWQLFKFLQLTCSRFVFLFAWYLHFGTIHAFAEFEMAKAEVLIRKLNVRDQSYGNQQLNWALPKWIYNEKCVWVMYCSSVKWFIKMYMLDTFKRERVKNVLRIMCRWKVYHKEW